MDLLATNLIFIIRKIPVPSEFTSVISLHLSLIIPVIKLQVIINDITPNYISFTICSRDFLTLSTKCEIVYNSYLSYIFIKYHIRSNVFNFATQMRLYKFLERTLLALMTLRICPDLLPVPKKTVR
jgi:hypothetical protein